MSLEEACPVLAQTELPRTPSHISRGHRHESTYPCTTSMSRRFYAHRVATAGRTVRSPKSRADRRRGIRAGASDVAGRAVQGSSGGDGDDGPRDRVAAPDERTRGTAGRRGRRPVLISSGAYPGAVRGGLPMGTRAEEGERDGRAYEATVGGSREYLFPLISPLPSITGGDSSDGRDTLSGPPALPGLSVWLRDQNPGVGVTPPSFLPSSPHETRSK